MTKAEEHIEFVEEKEEVKKESTGAVLRGIIDGSLLTRKTVTNQLPFIFFLLLLGLLYISNRYHADKMRRQIELLRTETRELRSESIYLSSELMKLSRQSEVAEEVVRRGIPLKEAVEPPKKIKK